MLIPGLLMAYLAFRSGGFYPGATSLAAAEMALVLALRFVLAKRPLQGVSKPLIVAVAAMGLFAAWTLFSADWSDSVSRALPAYSRALLCGLLLFFFGTLPFNARRVRWMVYGIAGAIVAISVAALIARLLPETIFDPALVDETRLGYPLTYWNTLGIVTCVGVILCFHIAYEHPQTRRSRGFWERRRCRWSPWLSSTRSLEARSGRRRRPWSSTRWSAGHGACSAARSRLCRPPRSS